jgi:topoisomerase IA-like protein
MTKQTIKAILEAIVIDLSPGEQPAAKHLKQALAALEARPDRSSGTKKAVAKPATTKTAPSKKASSAKSPDKKPASSKSPSKRAAASDRKLPKPPPKRHLPA